MPNFKMYLEIGSQGHKKKLSSKFKKNKKSQQFFAESLRVRVSAKGLCRELGWTPSAKGLWRELFFCSRQRIFS